MAHAAAIVMRRTSATGKLVDCLPYPSEPFRRFTAEHRTMGSMSGSGTVWDQAAIAIVFPPLKAERSPEDLPHAGGRVRRRRALLRRGAAALDDLGPVAFGSRAKPT